LRTPERGLRIERFFSKLKHFRRGATRCDKLGASVLAMIELASMRLWQALVSLRPS
jgi:transposase